MLRSDEESRLIVDAFPLTNFASIYRSLVSRKIPFLLFLYFQKLELFSKRAIEKYRLILGSRVSLQNLVLFGLTQNLEKKSGTQLGPMKLSAPVAAIL